jgi:hypothetical protein
VHVHTSCNHRAPAQANQHQVHGDNGNGNGNESGYVSGTELRDEDSEMWPIREVGRLRDLVESLEDENERLKTRLGRGVWKGDRYFWPVRRGRVVKECKEGGEEEDDIVDVSSKETQECLISHDEAEAEQSLANSEADVDVLVPSLIGEEYDLNPDGVGLRFDLATAKTVIAAPQAVMKQPISFLDLDCGSGSGDGNGNKNGSGHRRGSDGGEPITPEDQEYPGLREGVGEEWWKDGGMELEDEGFAGDVCDVDFLDLEDVLGGPGSRQLPAGTKIGGVGDQSDVKVEVGNVEPHTEDLDAIKGEEGEVTGAAAQVQPETASIFQTWKKDS